MIQTVRFSLASGCAGGNNDTRSSTTALSRREPPTPPRGAAPPARAPAKAANDSAAAQLQPLQEWRDPVVPGKTHAAHAKTAKPRRPKSLVIACTSSPMAARRSAPTTSAVTTPPEARWHAAQASSPLRNRMPEAFEEWAFFKTNWISRPSESIGPPCIVDPRSVSTARAKPPNESNAEAVAGCRAAGAKRAKRSFRIRPGRAK
mmetsp:Transcript_48621/g.135863  ORF Transcript_48621/g.135863 Transcript_48621/m.135863 type:complete len:204 (-) Transcript_48621:177-788(-)